MAILRVQGNARGTTVYAETSIAVTMASTPITGNVEIAVIGTMCASIPPFNTVSNIAQTGVVWTKIINLTYSDMNLNVEIWFGVVGANPSTAISVNLSKAADEYGCCANVCEYSGLLTTLYLDQTASASGHSTNTATGTTPMTTSANELWIGGIVVYDYTQNTPQNGFTLLDGAKTSHISLVYLEKIVTATGNASSGTTITNSYYTGCIATFKAGTGTARSKTVSEILGLVDAKSTKTAFHKTTSEVLGLMDGYDKNRCKKCKPSVTLTF